MFTAEATRGHQARRGTDSENHERCLADLSRYATCTFGQVDRPNETE